MKLKLHNIQGHKNSVFEIKEGINVLLGSTDAGKSTIIRALKWLVFNRPSADALMRTGATRMYVEVSEEGMTVRRLRSKVENLYIINGKYLRGFGTNVPIEVSKALNLSIHNFKFQHDPFFLLSDSGPERARVLNRFLNLDQITTVCKRASNEIRETKGTLKALRTIESDLSGQIEEFQPLEDQAQKILSIVSQMKSKEEIVKRGNKVKEAFTLIKVSQARGASLLDASNRLSDVLTNYERLFVRVKRYEELSGILRSLWMLKEKAINLKTELKDTKKAINALDLKRCSECGRIKE